MAAIPPDLQQEQARLTRVLAEIERQLASVRQTLAARRNSVLAGRRQLWQSGLHQVGSFEDLVILAQESQIMGEQERDHALYRRLLDRLERMYRSPYFGRIDFRELGYPDVESIYIGISSLVESGTGKHLVYDWRAPVSSMFYDAEPGRASYVSEAGIVEGDLLLKRQYKIEEGELRYYFDTNLKIDDDVLQEVLAKHADDKMRHIVTSIQREQNRIIRDEEHPVLIVQGPAGSGKTSIALHRAAYLLYRFRGRLTADNLLVFSPNEIFSDYISNVLPELGEEPIHQVTFIDYARRYLGSRLRLEAMEDQMEYLFTQRSAPEYALRVQSIRYKASPAFLQLIEAYVQHLESGAHLDLQDIYFRGRLIMDRHEMLHRLRHRYKDLPYAKRLGMLYRRIHYLLEEPKREAVARLADELAADPQSAGLSTRDIRRRSRRLVQAELRTATQFIEGWRDIDAVSLYYDLFQDDDLFHRLAADTKLPDYIGRAELERIRRATVESLNESFLPFEDVAPLLYLSLRVMGAPSSQSIRHVIVDEAQDYSVFHYQAMKALFPGGSFTILGDMNQSVHPYMNSGTYDAILETFADRDPFLIRLQRTYRSTLQIAQFTRAILGGTPDSESIQREGPLPRLVVVPEEERAEAIAREVTRMAKGGAVSIAIVCKTARESADLHRRIGSRIDAELIEKGDNVFRSGIVIVPVYLAKGLEFDGVIIADASRDAYDHETERKAFYTACTRALHYLTLFTAGEASRFLPPPESGLYERIG